MDSHLSDTFQPKDPKLWRFMLPECEYASLGEMLREIWGQPALKIVEHDSVILLAPVK